MSSMTRTDEATPPDRVDAIMGQWRAVRPDLDPSPQGVIARLHRLALALTSELVVVYEQFGLSEAEFDLLASLRRSGGGSGLQAGELAMHTMVTTGGLTKRVDRLIARGLVERGLTDGDKRQRIVRLTTEGRALIDEAATAHFANEKRLIDELGADDAAAVEPILRRWLELLDA